MARRIVVSMFITVCAAGLLASQAPAPTAAPTPRAQAAASQTPATLVTLVGCLYRERSIPGRTPNVAERVGVLEDYILADAKLAPGSSTGAGGVGQTSNRPETAQHGLKAGNMYKVENLPDERLGALVGKRIEVVGKIDAEPGDPPRGPVGAPAAAKPDRSAGPDRIELPEFEATSIKEVSGTCPATPAPRK